MKISQDIINQTITLANYSQHKQKIGCIITNKKNEVLSKGTILLKTHPIQFYYGVLNNKPKKIYMHAEINAIVKLNRNSNPYHIYVIRRNNHKLQLAKPCDICMSAILNTNIKYIFHSDTNQQIGVIKCY